MMSRAGSHGVRGVVGFTRVEGFTQHRSSSDTAAQRTAGAEAANAKPWKRHNNAKKREKLRRRVAGRLDA